MPYKNAINLYKKIFLDPDSLTKEIFKDFDFKNGCYEQLFNEKTVSVGFIKNKKISLNGKVLAFPFLFGLATDKDYRKRGFAKKIISNIVSDLNKKNYAFLGLYPFPAPKEFYYNFGFSTLSFAQEIAIKNLYISGTIIKRNLSVKSVNSLYKKVMQNKTFFQKFSSLDFKNYYKKVKAYNGELIGLFYNNYIYGFITLDNENVESALFDCEFVYKNKDKLLGDFPKKYQNAFLSNTLVVSNSFLFDNLSSYALIRPINHLKFIRCFRENFDLFDDFTIKLLIRDEILGNSKIKVVCKDKKLRIYSDFKGEDYTSLSVKEFTEYILYNKTDKPLPKTNKTVFDYSFFEKF